MKSLQMLISKKGQFPRMNEEPHRLYNCYNALVNLNYEKGENSKAHKSMIASNYYLTKTKQKSTRSNELLGATLSDRHSLNSTPSITCVDPQNGRLLPTGHMLVVYLPQRGRPSMSRNKWPKNDTLFQMALITIRLLRTDEQTTDICWWTDNHLSNYTGGLR